jgi:DNA helicase II / ATP-dependent DNA helicase PcrA
MSAPTPKVWLELPEQRAAITHSGSPLLILAGAGSGKTTVMARRMAHLIREQGWEPEQILGLTFSNKAASNLRARAISELGPGNNVSVQTYHGFGASIVNGNFERLGFTRLPRLIDRAEAWQLLYGALDAVTINHRKTGRLGSLINEALALASSCADHLVTIERVIENCQELLGVGGPRLGDNAKRTLHYRLDLCGLASAYMAAKKSYDCIDFSDQLALAAYAVETFADVANDLRHRYPVVLLDEYQDTNYAQRKLLELLYVQPSEDDGSTLVANVTAVGDDMQSIYGFRGAHLSNITNFEQHIPGAVECRLETNHRSGAAVVDIANYVQAQVGSARPKSLRVRDDAPAATLISFIGADDSAEAAEIARRCLAIGAPWAEIAVLCRKRKVIPAIVSALRAAGVPVDVMGMGGLLARPEVVDLMAWLEIICAPTDSTTTTPDSSGSDQTGSFPMGSVSTGFVPTGFDSAGSLSSSGPQNTRIIKEIDATWLGPDPSIALLRILQGPRFRLGMRDLGALGRSARALAKDRQGDDRRVDLMAALEQTDSISELSVEAYGRCRQFVHLRSTLRALLARSASERSIADVVDLIAQHVGLYDDVDTLGYENLLRFIDVAARFSPLSDRAPQVENFSASGSDRVEQRIFHDDGSGVSGNAQPDAQEQPGAQGKPGHDPLYREPPTVRAVMLSFLEYLQLVAESEDDPAEATQTGADAVQIMSIHQAKGLEFDTVFLAGIAGTKKSSSIFPDERLPANGVTQAAVLPPWLQADGDPTVPPIGNIKELKALAEEARQRANEEELRLLYVAVTRARKNLICSTGHWYPGPSTAHGPSAFFELLQASGLVQLAKSEPAATEDPAAAQRKRRLNELNEKLERKRRAKSSDPSSGAAGVETGLFGEPLPVTAGRTKSKRLKPRPTPLQSTSVSLDSPSAQRFLPTSLPVSALGVVAICPRKYHWTYVLPLPRRRSPAAEFGTAVHTWIESNNSGTVLPFPVPERFAPFAQPASPSVEESINRATLEADQGGLEGKGTEETARGTGAVEVIANGVQRNFLNSRFASQTPAVSESAFSFAPKLAAFTCSLSGRIDAVYYHDDGTVELVDFKTGPAPKDKPGTDSPGANPFFLAIDTAVQMACYGLLALDSWGVAAEKLRTTVCYLGGEGPVLHTTHWDNDVVVRQRDLVRAQIIKTRAGSSAVIPGPACSSCDFSTFCEGAAQVRTK